MRKMLQNTTSEEIKEDDEFIQLEGGDAFIAPKYSYTLKCQRCENRFKMKVVYNAVFKEKLERILGLDMIITLDTEQFKNRFIEQGDKTYFSSTQSEIPFDVQVNIREIMGAWWKVNKKGFIRRMYGRAKHFKAGKLLCDRCYRIAKIGS